MTQQLVKKDAYSRIVIDQLDPSRLLEDGKSSQIMVPLMSRFDDNLISKLKETGKLKAIIQFGVGVEGIDLVSAKRNDVAVLNMPAGPTGNALSTAELALYLSMAILRRAHECDER